MIMPGRALLRREMTTLGILGAAAYTAIWIDAAWPVGRRASTRACQGMALGMFATIPRPMISSGASRNPTMSCAKPRVDGH